MTTDDFPKRSHPAHAPIYSQGNQAVILFLTVCSKDRKPIFDNEEFHQAVCNVWINSDHWLVGKYMIMPDHIHMFCTPNHHPVYPLRQWMKFWKRQVSKQLAQGAGRSLWQKDGWDTQLRRGESYTQKWAYVRDNPVRAGLVDVAELWPFQGELNGLSWHDE